MAAALLAAAVLPSGPPGIGVPLLAVLIAAGVVSARRPAPRVLVFLGLGIVLASFSAVRDAGWVVAVDLCAAWLIGCVAVAGSRVAAVGAPFARLTELPGVVPQGPRGLAPAFRGAVLGGFVVVPFAGLFLAADAAFAELGSRIPLPSVESIPVRVATFGIVLVAALGLALVARRPLEAAERTARGRLAPIEWTIPLVSLVALFAAFVAVQLAVLFGGHDHVLETAGLTYAEYAREGFWELLTAAALTLTVIAAAARLAVTPQRRHRILLTTLLGLLCTLTLVVLASALHRLQLYEDAYGLTRLRLSAEALALWLGGAFVVVVVAGLVRAVRSRLADLAAAGTALALIAFSLVNPDALIAKRNIAHWHETGRIDIPYLSRLSADAVPELARLPRPVRDDAVLDLADELGQAEPWSSTNLGRERARDGLERSAH